MTEALQWLFTPLPDWIVGFTYGFLTSCLVRAVLRRRKARRDGRS